MTMKIKFLHNSAPIARAQHVIGSARHHMTRGVYSGSGTFGVTTALSKQGNLDLELAWQAIYNIIEHPQDVQYRFVVSHTGAV
jgi:hypothetical protein